jgi:hypothetical protein
VRALTFTVAYEIDQATLAKIIRDRPSIADEISVTLSGRAKAMGAGIASDTDAAAGQSASWLVGRIRQLFELPNG